MQDIHVRLEDVTKVFGATRAVDHLNLDIPAGTFATLLGPSGCGKTTTLRMIAGFFDPDGGDIYIRGARQNGLPPFKRNVSIVFQEYALFPHMTVFENISYGLKVRKTPRAEMQRKIEEIVVILGLEGLEGRGTHQLSGGQQQRVALARSLVLEPDVLLMDEPMSNLDAKLRIRLRAELRTLQQRLGITTIYVTHDQEEALSLSDVVAVMDQGRLQQFSDPWSLYFRPQNRFVADFVGLANFMPAKAAAIPGAGGEDETTLIHIAGQQGNVTVPPATRRNGMNAASGETYPGIADVTVMVRPEWATLQKAHPNGDGADQRGDALVLPGKVEAHSFLGTVVRYWVACPDLNELFIVDTDARSSADVLEGAVDLIIPWDRMHVVGATSSEAVS